MRFYTRSDVERYVSDQLTRIDSSCYEIDINEINESATFFYIRELVNKYGAWRDIEIPTDDNIDIYELIKDL